MVTFKHSMIIVVKCSLIMSCAHMRLRHKSLPKDCNGKVSFFPE